jgi:penicillin-binding protein
MEKKTKIALITIFIIVLAIITGVFIWYIQKWEKSKKLNTPEEVAKTYFENINEKKYEEAYKLLSDESKQKISQEEFSNVYENFNKEIECIAIKTDNIGCENIDTDTSNITYVNNIRSLYGEYKYGNNIYLKKQADKKYYIDWNYSSIYPKYESGDKVEVNIDNAKRGSIIDRNGVLLSGSGYISSIGLVPGWMNEETKVEDIKKVAELLGMSVDTVNKKLTASYVKTDTFVELDTVSKNELQLLASLREIDGIKIKDVESRVYPLGEKAAHITGYVQKASKEDIEENKLYDENTIIGRAGLEKTYDDRLRGKNGYELILQDESGKEKTTIFKCDKVEGENIKYTIYTMEIIVQLLLWIMEQVKS